MFAALDEFITEARLALAQKIYAVLWVILTIPLAVFYIMVIMDEAWYDTIYSSISHYCTSTLILFSTIFFQFQAFYLAYVIYSSKKNKKDPNVIKSITSTVLINLAIALLDWIALGVQFYQLFAFDDTKFVYWVDLCLQFSTAIVALHGSLSIYIFLQFKKLTFAGTAVGAKLKKKGPRGAFNLKVMDKSKPQQGLSSPTEILPTEISPTEISPTENLPTENLPTKILPTEISPSPTQITNSKY
jgi:hypothetical protein